MVENYDVVLNFLSFTGFRVISKGETQIRQYNPQCFMFRNV